MREMTVNQMDIARFGARLLNFSVGGTVLTTTSGTSLHANFPKLFHTDFGMREIKITLVFKPKHYEKDMIKRLNDITKQKSAFDALLCNKVVDIWLPDNFYYNCLLSSIGTEGFDSESLEVSYTFNGIRHLPLADSVGKTVYCHSTVKTDCRITVNFVSGWDNSIFYFIINNGTSDYNYIKIKNISNNDNLVIDGIEKRVTKNNINIFGDTEIITFPYLIPGRNLYMQITSGECTFRTEYYPTFI